MTDHRGRGVQVIRPDGSLSHRAAAMDPASLPGWLKVITEAERGAAAAAEAAIDSAARGPSPLGRQSNDAVE
jgi:hypothetical protein